MNTLNFLTNLVTSPIAKWGVSIIAGGWFLMKFTAAVMDIKNAILAWLKAQIGAIQDPEIQQACRIAVRYIAKRIPDASDNEKLQEAIKFVQEHTPDIVVSDEKVKIVVETAYREFKAEAIALGQA